MEKNRFSLLFRAFFRGGLFLVGIAIALAGAGAGATTLTWDANGGSAAADGSANWSTATTTWWNGSAATAATAADTVTIGTGAALAASDTVTLTSNVVVGNLTFNYLTNGSNNYTIAGGTGPFTLTLGGAGGSSAAVISVGGGLATSGITPVIGAALVNSGGLTFADSLIAGTPATNADENIELTGAGNSLTGTVTIGGTAAGGTGGILVQVGTGSGVFTSLNFASSVTVQDGSTLRLSSSATTINNLILAGAGQISTSTPRGALSLFNLNGILNGGITLAANTGIVLSTTKFTVNSNIGESGGSQSLTYNNNQSGAPDLVLTGTDTYTGGTTFNMNNVGAVAAFTVDVNGDANFGAAPASSGTNITFTGNSGAAASNSATLRADASFTLNANRNIAVSNLSGFTVDTQANALTIGGAISGTVPFTKAGTGTLTLAGANTYTGATTVGAGTLAVTGSLANTAVTVASGATLRGTGTLGGATTILNGATLLVGNDATTTGTAFTFGNGLTMNSGSTLEFVIGVSGAHTTLALGAGANVLNPTSITLLGTIGAGFYDNIVTGVSSDLGEMAWTITNAGYTGTFTWDGSHIDLAVAAVPEPGTVALLGVSVLLLALRLARPRRAAVLGA